MQNEAFKKLYALKELVKKCDDPAILADWKYLQVSDHFYYMSTKFFSDGEVHKYFNPYESPYDAFINYMNVLSDFSERVKLAVSETEMEVSRLGKIIKEKDALIERMKDEMNLSKEGPDKKSTSSDKKKTVKAPAKKAPVKKPAGSGKVARKPKMRQ